MFTFFYDKFNSGVGDGFYIALDWRVKDRRDYSFARAARYYDLYFYTLLLFVVTLLGALLASMSLLLLRR